MTQAPNQPHEPSSNNPRTKSTHGDQFPGNTDGQKANNLTDPNGNNSSNNQQTQQNQGNDTSKEKKNSPIEQKKGKGKLLNQLNPGNNDQTDKKTNSQLNQDNGNLDNQTPQNNPQNDSNDSNKINSNDNSQAQQSNLQQNQDNETNSRANNGNSQENDTSKEKTSSSTEQKKEKGAHSNPHEKDSKKYTFIYEKTTIQLNSTDLVNDFHLFDSLNQYFQHFVRIENQSEYKKVNIIPPKDTEIKLEKSLPMIELKDKIYIFKDVKELIQFYKNKGSQINSIKFHEKKLKISTLSDEISDYARNNYFFDYRLIINASKIINMEFKIDGKTENIEMAEGISEEDKIEKIQEEYYNGCPFIKLKITDDNTVHAQIIIHGKGKCKCKKELKNRKITVKEFLDEIKDKYELKGIEPDYKESLKSKIIELKTDEAYLTIKNLDLIQLNIDDKMQKVSKLNTLGKVLENIFPGDSESKYFIISGKIISDKNQLAFKFAEKRLKIFDFKENSITIEINCKYLNVDPIQIDTKNIKLLESCRNIINEIIDRSKINRNPNYLEIKCNDSPLTEIIIAKKMRDDEGNVVIPLDVTIKKAPFILKVNDDKDGTYHKEFINEKISTLSKEYKCDKIKLYDIDNRLIDDDKTFLYLTPEKEYRVEMLDIHSFILPKSKKSKEKTLELELPRFDTFEHALSLQDETKDIPYLVFSGKKNITKDKITEKKDKPLNLKINYKFVDIKTKKDQYKETDELSSNVLKFIADKILLVSVERVEAHFITNDEQKEVKKDDTLEDFDYKVGYAFNCKRLPPILQFEFNSSDIKDIENICINNDINIPEEPKFKTRFPEDSKINDAIENIRKKYNIKNDISFEGNKKLKDRDTLMSELPESEIIKIRIEPPEYTFNFERSDHQFRFKTNETIKSLLKNPTFKSEIKPANSEHDMQFTLLNKKEEKIELNDDDKLFDYYGKGVINCVDLDPLYIFSFEGEDFETRISDDTTFDDTKKIIRKQFKKLKNVLLNRIAFYGNKDDDKELNDTNKVKDKFNRKNNKIIVKLLDPQYDFIITRKETKSLRLNEACTVKDAIKEIGAKLIDITSCDIQLRVDDDEEREKVLEEDEVLFDKKYYEKNITIRRIPLMFHFIINDSEKEFPVRFSIDKSANITFNKIYETNRIKIHDDKIGFDLLEDDQDEAKLPPIERFEIRNDDGEEQKHDTPFFEIMKKDKQKQIRINLLPPIFNFKIRSSSNKIELTVERGKKVIDIKKAITDKLKLGPYDFYLKINDKTLNEDNNFDDYEQDDIFTVIPRDPLYTFRLKVGPNTSQPKQFRLNPYITIREVKSIIFPQISSKRLEVLYGDKVLNDTDELKSPSNDTKEYTIFLRNIQRPIILPEILGAGKVTLLMKEDDTVKDIKSNLIKERREELENKEIGLYLTNKKLDDETKYTDFFFINNIEIECKLLFNIICTKESAVKFDNFQEVLDDKITINDCRKKCLAAIKKKNPESKCRNINRVSIKIKDTEIESKFDHKNLFKIFQKLDEYKEIQVTVEEDKLFENVSGKDYKKGELSKKFHNESNVEEIRKSLGYNFIIKSTPSEMVIYDDMPLFSIPGKIYREELTDNKAKQITIKISPEIETRIKSDRKRKINFTADSNVEDLKHVVHDVFLTGKMGVNDINIAVIPEIPNKKDDDDDSINFPEGYELTNFKKKRILCDSQNLATFTQNTVYVVKRDVAIDGKPAVSLFYINKDTKKEDKMNVEYKDTDTVNDLLSKLDPPDELYNSEQAILYMGKVQHLDKKLKDIIVGDNVNFYATIIQNPPDV